MESTHRRKWRGPRKRGIGSVIGMLFFVFVVIVAFSVFTLMFNSFYSFVGTEHTVDHQTLQREETSLSFPSFQFGSQSAAVSVDASCGSATVTPTLNTNGNKLVFAAGMWWSFFICSTNNFGFSTSFDGLTWEAVQTPGGALSTLGVGSTFSLYLIGTTIYIAISNVGAKHFVYATATLVSGGTVSAPAGTFTQATGSPYSATTTNNALGPISIEVDASGNTWVALTTGATDIEIYEHPAGSAANAGWTANIAPTSTPNLGSLSANASPIILPPPSSISTTGAVPDLRNWFYNGEDNGNNLDALGNDRFRRQLEHCGFTRRRRVVRLLPDFFFCDNNWKRNLFCGTCFLFDWCDNRHAEFLDIHVHNDSSFRFSFYRNKN